MRLTWSSSMPTSSHLKHPDSLFDHAAKMWNVQFSFLIENWMLLAELTAVQQGHGCNNVAQSCLKYLSLCSMLFVLIICKYPILNKFSSV